MIFKFCETEEKMSHFQKVPGGYYFLGVTDWLYKCDVITHNSIVHHPFRVIYLISLFHGGKCHVTV